MSPPALGLKTKTDRGDLMKLLKYTHRIKSRKAKVKIPTLLDRCNHTRNGQKTTVSYFTASKSLIENNLPGRNVFDELSPFDMSNRNFGKDKKSGSKRYLEPTYRGKQNQDLLERLYIPIDTSSIPKSKCDIDQDFFNIIQGRPTAQKFSRTEFLDTVRQTFVANLSKGFIKDEVLHINEQTLLKEWHTSQLNQDYEDLLYNYDIFFGQQNEKSRNIRKAKEEIKEQRKEKEMEVATIRRSMDAIKGSLTMLFSILQKQRICKHILYYVSPTEWQDEYQIMKKQTRRQIEAEIWLVWYYYTESVKYDVDNRQLHCIVKNTVDEMRMMGPPENYFKEPWQVDQVFREIELQNLRCLSHITAIKQLRDKIRYISESLVSYFKKDIKAIEILITETENSLVYHRDRSKYLEEITLQRLNSSFKEMTSGTECLNIMALVQDLYERIVGANENDLDCLGMMRDIEAAFCDLRAQLRGINTTTIRIMENKEIEKKRAILKEAATTLYRQKQIERMLDSMDTIYEPAIPWTSFGKQLKWRSKPPMEIEKKIKRRSTVAGKMEPEPEPQRQDWQRLKFFVDYSEDEDKDEYQNRFDLEKELEDKDEDEMEVIKYDIQNIKVGEAEERRLKLLEGHDDVASLDSDWREWWKAAPEEHEEVPEEKETE